MNKTLVAGLLLVLCLPLLGVFPVSAEPGWLQLKVGDSFTVTSTKGFVVTAEDGRIVRKISSLTLIAQITEVGKRGMKFHVTSGTITVESQTIAVMSADGSARYAPRLKGAAMTLHGSVTNGELSLAGRIHREAGVLLVGLAGRMVLGSSLYSLRLSGTVRR
ncbi:MAG: hypothetical protein V1857_05220 [archaeon]